MLDEDRDCHEIVQQLSAVNAAVESATAAFVQAYARECLLDPDSIEPGGREATVDQILGLMTKLR
jgi:DNA-binding FrmR family transcriptional regulator